MTIKRFSIRITRPAIKLIMKIMQFFSRQLRSSYARACYYSNSASGRSFTPRVCVAMQKATLSCYDLIYV